MAKEFSFDIVSDYESQELVNALDQTRREIQTRYDFKGSNASIDFGDNKESLILIADSDYKIQAVLDILMNKMIGRKLSLKILDLSQNLENASGGSKRQRILLKKGLDQEKAKKITKLVRDKLPKVKTAIQGEAIRVSSPKKDELQAVMALLREEKSFDFPIQFQNFR